MRLLLMVLYVALLESERKPKRRWWQKSRKVDSLLTYAESGLPATHAEPKPSPTTKPPSTEGELSRRVKKAITGTPETLVEKEHAAAMRLQMPPIPGQGDFVHVNAGRARYDTPIGRTLTRELLHRNTQHCPYAAVRHLPLDDVARSVLGHDLGSPQPTSPRRRATDPKGRATPKRPRRNHDLAK
jgi:hypothetical protein